MTNTLEKGNSELFNQLSQLTSHVADDARESRKLLTLQVDEQRGLKETLVSFNIGERLTESTRLQQRALATGLEDFQQQRGEMLRTLNEQTEANNNFRSELQQLGRQLGTLSQAMSNGNNEICSQISELMVHMAADAKEANRLLMSLASRQTTAEQVYVEG